MDFLKALQVAAAQSVGAHVQSEMPPLPQLPRITASKHQHSNNNEKVKECHHRPIH
jgi:hypothetical protein